MSYFPPLTNSALVQGVLNDDYTPGVDLTPYITAANVMVNTVVRKAQARPRRYYFNMFQMEVVERWLAASLYCMSDKAFQNNTVGQASTTYQGQTGNFLTANYYGQMAMRLDPTGLLETVGRDERRVASVRWAGKRNQGISGYLGDNPVGGLPE
jgi:hypothetical protein